METSKKWYQNPLVILLLIVFFFPVGLFLMWKYTNWNKSVKWIVTALFLGLFIFGATTNRTDRNLQATDTPQVTQSPTAISTAKPVEKLNIVVSSQIVKKVDGKYRYFFDIRNQDTKPFEGSVTISLFNNELKNPLGKDTFDTTKSIEPSLGTSVYIDANTGPTGVHGANGITKFKYSVNKGNDVINTGDGIIVNKLENLDSLGL